MSANDAEKVLVWRNSDRVRMNMYTDHVIGSDEHATWIQFALKADTARYLIFELNDIAVGFVSITGVDRRNGRATWAFYLGEVAVPRGTGIAMEFLALEYAFETLEIRKLTCEVLTTNASVIKLHGRFGFQQEALYRAHVVKGGHYVDAVALALFRDTWMANKAHLSKLAFLSET